MVRQGQGEGARTKKGLSPLRLPAKDGMVAATLGPNGGGGWGEEAARHHETGCVWSVWSQRHMGYTVVYMITGWTLGGRRLGGRPDEDEDELDAATLGASLEE